MAIHLVDRKILGRLAAEVSEDDNVLSKNLFQILGLSRALSRRLFRARMLRRLEPTNPKAVKVYYHIIWLSREGLSIVEQLFTDYVQNDRVGLELRIFMYKLRASFYHIFALFHNRPSVNPLNPAGDPPQGEQVPTVLLPVPGNRQIAIGSTPPRNGKAKDPNDPSPPSRVPTGIRDSILSDTSNITNPFGSISGLSPPPGLPGRDASQIPDPGAFLLPSTNFVPITIASFDAATNLANQHLSGSSPLRLCIALEYSAFKWDCLHDHAASRRLAQNTITTVYNAQEGMDDNDFDDAASVVGTLARMVKRKSQEPTPRFGAESPAPEDAAARAVPPPVPEVPQITIQQERALREEAKREEERAQQEIERQQNMAALRPVTPRRNPETRQALSQAEGNPRSAPSASDKPLPELPRQEPSYNIPRRPVGTPPGVKSRSRSDTAEEGEEDLTPTQARVVPRVTPAELASGRSRGQQQGMLEPEAYPQRGSSSQQGGRSQQESHPPRGSSLQQGRSRQAPIIQHTSSVQQERRQEGRSSEGRVPKRKNDVDDGNEGSSSGAARSFIPRLRVRNP